MKLPDPNTSHSHLPLKKKGEPIQTDSKDRLVDPSRWEENEDHRLSGDAIS